MNVKKRAILISQDFKLKLIYQKNISLKAILNAGYYNQYSVEHIALPSDLMYR